MLLHEFDLPIVHFPNVSILTISPCVSANSVRKSESAIIVNWIDSIRINLSEFREVHTEGISLQKDDVFRVNCSDCRHDSIVKCKKTSPLLICGLVQQIISCNPCVRPISGCYDFPQIDDTVLKVLVIPKSGVSSGVIAVPVLGLTTWSSVKVYYRIYAVFRTLWKCGWAYDKEKGWRGKFTSLMTLSTCLKPSSLITIGFISSSKWW